MSFAKTLTRDEMKNIRAGTCRIYSNGEWGGCGWTSYEAELWYDKHDDVTGYCCASCGSEPFENAEPCVA